MKTPQNQVRVGREEEEGMSLITADSTGKYYILNNSQLTIWCGQVRTVLTSEGTSL